MAAPLLGCHEAYMKAVGRCLRGNEGQPGLLLLEMKLNGPFQLLQQHAALIQPLTPILQWHWALVSARPAPQTAPPSCVAEVAE